MFNNNNLFQYSKTLNKFIGKMKFKMKKLFGYKYIIPLVFMINCYSCFFKAKTSVQNSGMVIDTLIISNSYYDTIQIVNIDIENFVNSIDICEINSKELKVKPISIDFFKYSKLLTGFNPQLDKDWNKFKEYYHKNDKFYLLGFNEYNNYKLFLYLLEYPGLNINTLDRILYLHLVSNNTNRSYLITLATCIERNMDNSILSNTMINNNVFVYFSYFDDGTKTEFKYFINEAGEIQSNL